MAARVVITLDSDDEDVAPLRPTSCVCASRGASSGASSSNAHLGTAAQPVVIDSSDDDDEVIVVERVPRPSASGTCALCSKPLGGGGRTYRLSECGHTFHFDCARDRVKKRLSESLASEVGCPTCDAQLTFADVQALHDRSSSSRAPPPHLAHQSTFAAMASSILGKRTHAGASALAALAAGSGGGSALAWTEGRVVGSPSATKRISRELGAICRADGDLSSMLDVAVPDESNVYVWQVEFFGFERGTALARDLQRVPGQRIVLRVAFPSDFPTRVTPIRDLRARPVPISLDPPRRPAQPPYVRVIRPRFVYRTGHVTIGGSICTEMLTSAGWSPTMTMESVRHLPHDSTPAARALSTPPHALAGSPSDSRQHA